MVWLSAHTNNPYENRASTAGVDQRLPNRNSWLAEAASSTTIDGREHEAQRVQQHGERCHRQQHAQQQPDVDPFDVAAVRRTQRLHEHHETNGRQQRTEHGRKIGRPHPRGTAQRIAPVPGRQFPPPNAMNAQPVQKSWLLLMRKAICIASPGCARAYDCLLELPRHPLPECSTDAAPRWCALPSRPRPQVQRKLDLFVGKPRPCEFRRHGPYSLGAMHISRADNDHLTPAPRRAVQSRAAGNRRPVLRLGLRRIEWPVMETSPPHAAEPLISSSTKRWRRAAPLMPDLGSN